MKRVLCIFIFVLMTSAQNASAMSIKRCVNIPTDSAFWESVGKVSFSKVSPVEWVSNANSLNIKFRGIAACSDEYGTKTTTIRGSSLPDVANSRAEGSCYCKVTAPVRGEYWVRSNERPYVYGICMSNCAQYCINSITSSNGQLIKDSLGI